MGRRLFSTEKREPEVNDPVANLVERWRQGDQQAAAELFQRYASRLIALAHSRLPTNLSHRVDPAIIAIIAAKMDERTINAAS